MQKEIKMEHYLYPRRTERKSTKNVLNTSGEGRKFML